MLQIDSVIVVQPVGAPMDLADRLTVLGLIATAIGLLIAAWQLRQSRLTRRATFLLELYRSMDQHNAIHSKFSYGGWAHGNGPSTTEELMQLGRLLGLFEYIALLVKDRVLTLDHVDRLYAYRLVHPFTNPEVAGRYFAPGGGWDNVVALEKKLQGMPLYSDMKQVALAAQTRARAAAPPEASAPAPQPARAAGAPADASAPAPVQDGTDRTTRTGGSDGADADA